MDVITQYGAEGYYIAASCVIDSTMYDYLDGIKVNAEIDTQGIDIMMLERLLAKHRN